MNGRSFIGILKKIDKVDRDFSNSSVEIFVENNILDVFDTVPIWITGMSGIQMVKICLIAVVSPIYYEILIVPIL